MLVSESLYGYKWIKWLTEIEDSNNTKHFWHWRAEVTQTTPNILKKQLILNQTINKTLPNNNF
jgi:hypothetical protein